MAGGGLSDRNRFAVTAFLRTFHRSLNIQWDDLQAMIDPFANRIELMQSIA